MAGVLKPIKKLASEDIDKIAAGEVIQRPRNAVKELIENSLDAGAKNIHVTVNYSAPSDFKLIKIKDDGHGFRKEDLSLACERFATSKLGKFEDLLTVNTFGFRGEALASISRIARVSISSKSQDSPIGYSMDYENGIPTKNDPVMKATNPGTLITIRDLFHNDQKRRNTLQIAAEEYKKIVELLSLYSLDNLDVSFQLTKERSSSDDLRTVSGEDLRTRVKNVMGSKVANNLVPLFLDNLECKFSASGLFGDLNSSLKSFKTIIFVNKRLVECAPLKKAIEAIYKSRLSKGCCPFVLISLTIKANLDINIHPTKQEVRFDYEERVISSITDYIDSALTSKTTTIVGSGQSPLTSRLKLSTGTISKSIASSSPSNSSRPDLMNRSNPSIQTIDSMVKNLKVKNLFWREVTLTSVHHLAEEVESNVDHSLKKILAESTFVGTGDKKNPSILFQSGTKLFSIPIEPLTCELFYQRFVSDFGNFGVIELDQKPPIEGLLKAHLRLEHFAVGEIVEIIMSHRTMMDDYFSIVITEDGLLQGLPILVPGYFPDFNKLPKFLYELGSKVEWSSEKECFESCGECLSGFYSFSSLSATEKMDEVIRDHLFPLIRKKFKPSVDLKGKVCDVSSVPTLYKVFHRC